jgi:hypothetical protein
MSLVLFSDLLRGDGVVGERERLSKTSPRHMMKSTGQ